MDRWLVDVAKYYVLHNLATYASQRNRPVIFWILLATLLLTIEGLNYNIIIVILLRV